MLTKRVIFYTVAIAIIAFLIALLTPAVRSGRSDTGYVFTRTEMDIKAISGALSQFEIAYNSLPGGDNPTIFRALLGSHNLHIAFLDPGKTNSNGEMLDPWGSPYEIEITGSTNILIKSAGKNGKFGDKDDYVFDGLKREYIQDPLSR